MTSFRQAQAAPQHRERALKTGEYQILLTPWNEKKRNGGRKCLTFNTVSFSLAMFTNQCELIKVNLIVPVFLHVNDPDSGFIDEVNFVRI